MAAAAALYLSYNSGWIAWLENFGGGVLRLLKHQSIEPSFPTSENFDGPQHSVHRSSAVTSILGRLMDWLESLKSHTFEGIFSRIAHYTDLESPDTAKKERCGVRARDSGTGE
jgi:hypothetical protein